MNYYQVLDVEQTATQEEIKAAYNNLIKAFHPDYYRGSNKDFAEAKTQQINEAYEILGDFEKRAEYDMSLKRKTKKQKADEGDYFFQDTNYYYRIDNGSKGVDAKALLASLSQFVDIAQALKNIEKGKEYVVEIPMKYQDAFKKGQYFINKNQKTNISWPTLVEKLPNGKYKFIDNLPVKEREAKIGQTNLGSNIFNLCLQQQIQELSGQLEATYNTVKRIERGQTDDRIGKLETGRKQVARALMINDETVKKNTITTGLNNIEVAKEQIGQTLKSRAESFDPVPKGKVAQFANEVKKTGYLNGKDDEVEGILDYYQLYHNATEYLVSGYRLIGEEEVIPDIIDDSLAFVETIDFSKVKTIDYVHDKEKTKSLPYNNPTLKFDIEKKKSLEGTDVITLELTGSDIQEVLNGK